MSIPKQISFVAIVGLIGVIAGSVYVLWPTILDISGDVVFRGLVGTSVPLARPMYLHECTAGSYRFVPAVLGIEAKTPCTLLIDVPAGSIIRVTNVKQYTNNLGSGSTSLWVLGEYTSVDGRRFGIEYEWGEVDLSRPFSSLPMAFWQTDRDAPFVFMR